jgi:hypothetical protein
VASYTDHWQNTVLECYNDPLVLIGVGQFSLAIQLALDTVSVWIDTGRSDKSNPEFINAFVCGLPQEMPAIHVACSVQLDTL